MWCGAVCSRGRATGDTGGGGGGGSHGVVGSPNEPHRLMVGTVENGRGASEPHGRPWPIVLRSHEFQGRLRQTGSRQRGRGCEGEV